MILRALRKHRRNQRGFTLIELLVVITVIGALAAVVTISVVGVTSRGRENARAAELQTVQVAFDAMLTDQFVPRTAIDKCPALAPGATAPPESSFTDDMTRFPANAPAYVDHSSGHVVVLATFYLRQKTTAQKYACDSNGNIYQKLK